MKKPIADATAALLVALPVQRAPPEPASFHEDWAVDMLRRIIKWQFEQIEMKPPKTMAAANRRAREARSVSELVNAITKLDAAEKRRERKGRKAQGRDDSTAREDFIRRLDQLLATTG
jgi:hypothetical protein